MTATLTPRGTVSIQLADRVDSELVKRIPGRAYAGKGHWDIPGTVEAINQLKSLLPLIDVDASVVAHLAAKSVWSVRVAEARAGKLNLWPDDKITAQPYDHQVTGHAVVNEMFTKSQGAALWHSAGLGKSLTALAVIAARTPRLVLVVCPASVIGVWSGEVEKFAWQETFPIRVWPLTGSMEKRAGKIMTLPIDPFDGTTMLVTNYEALWRPALLNALLSVKLDIVIADEAHRLKNATSQQSKAARKIASSSLKLALTGTPTDTPGDWYGIYRWLDPSVFGTSLTAFRARYFNDFTLPNGQRLPGKVWPEMEPELYAKANSLAHVADKDEVLDLPEQINLDRVVDLEPKARKLYEQMRQEAITFIDEGGDQAIVGQNVLTRRLRMQQITGGFVKDENGVSHSVSTAKIDAARDILTDALVEGKVVIVARFTAEIDALVAMCAGLKVKTGVIDGRVKIGTARDEVIADFQTGKMQVIILQPKAGGVGITLHASSTMIVYSCDTSLIDWTQVISRIHRVGTVNRWRYYLLQASGTIDEKVFDALKEKQDVSRYGLAQWRAVLA